MMRRVLLAALLACCAVRPAAADAGWFESGDVVLRNDLLLLNDAAVIRLPIEPDVSSEFISILYSHRRFLKNKTRPILSVTMSASANG